MRLETSALAPEEGGAFPNPEVVRMSDGHCWPTGSSRPLLALLLGAAELFSPNCQPSETLTSYSPPQVPAHSFTSTRKTSPSGIIKSLGNVYYLPQ